MKDVYEGVAVRHLADGEGGPRNQKVGILRGRRELYRPDLSLEDPERVAATLERAAAEKSRFDEFGEKSPSRKELLGGLFGWVVVRNRLRPHRSNAQAIEFLRTVMRVGVDRLSEKQRQWLEDLQNQKRQWDAKHSKDKP